MTAENTALQVVRWAVDDVNQALPEGDLTAAVRLAEPAGGTLYAVGRLAAVTAARLRLDAPALGDTRPPGLSALLLAAAVGAHRLGERAALVLRAVRVPSRAADLLAHHGLVAPAAARLPGLDDQLRDLSPLTGVLDRPGPGSGASCESLVDRLLADRSARRMLITRFAAPPDTAEQARWRGECLAFTRHEDPDFVLDVYRSALQQHGDRHEIRARRAWRQVLDGTDWRAAVPTASWWRALAEMEAAEPARVRGLAGRRVGTNLFRRVQMLEAAS